MWYVPATETEEEELRFVSNSVGTCCLYSQYYQYYQYYLMHHNLPGAHRRADGRVHLSSVPFSDITTIIIIVVHGIASLNLKEDFTIDLKCNPPLGKGFKLKGF